MYLLPASRNASGEYSNIHRWIIIIIFFSPSVLDSWRYYKLLVEGEILDSTTSVVSHMMQQQSCHETKWNWTVGWSPKYAEVDVRFPSHLQCNQLFGDLVHPGRRGRDRLLVQTSRKLLDRSKMYSRAPHTSQSCALMRSPWHRPQSQTWFECTMLQRCWQSTRPMWGFFRPAMEWACSHQVVYCQSSTAP